uniref:DDE Tnp4 domain-containing protein n=1 Tax=Anopheles epiroticus TaxID=199890 RepID=A0A182PWY8_9DIPT
FIRNFRVSKSIFNHILSLIAPEISPRHNKSLTAKQKLAATLKFLAQGSYQQGVGNDFTIPMRLSTFSEVLDETLKVMEKCLSQNISLEMNEEEKTDSRNYFYQKSGITGVVGCIDGSHVRILAPHANPVVYYNRKGYYSLNVLMVSDSAYPTKPWLIKPHRNAAPNSPEAIFNQHLAKARAVIENAFGILKE